MDVILSIQHGMLLRVKHLSLLHQVCTSLKEKTLPDLLTTYVNQDWKQEESHKKHSYADTQATN